MTRAARSVIALAKGGGIVQWPAVRSVPCREVAPRRMKMGRCPKVDRPSYCESVP